MAGRLGSTVASGPTGRVGHGFWLRQLRWAWNCAIKFDSMTLRKQFLHNTQTGAIEGFVDLFGVAEEESGIAALLEDRKAVVASELMVFWVTSFGKVKSSFALGHFAVGKQDSADIHVLWRASVEAAKTHGWRVRVGCCDGASEVCGFLQPPPPRPSPDRSPCSSE